MKETGVISFIDLFLDNFCSFTVRSGKTTVGTGIVTKVYDELTEEQVAEWFDTKASLKKPL
jgi:hypothetical protein